MQLPNPAFCFNPPTIPANSNPSYLLPQNKMGQQATMVCKFGYEFADAAAKAAPSGNAARTNRRMECDNVTANAGGNWTDLDIVPEACYGM